MSAQYREYRPPAGLRAVSACLWELTPAADHVQLVIPDGCVDLILLAGHGLVLAGADTGPRRVAVPGGSVSTGIRLRPAAAGAVLGQPASEIRDQEVAAALVWGKSGERLAEELAGAGPRQRLELLARPRGGPPGGAGPAGDGGRAAAGRPARPGGGGGRGPGGQRAPAQPADARRRLATGRDAGPGRAAAAPSRSAGTDGIADTRGADAAAGRGRSWRGYAEPVAHDRRGAAPDRGHARPIPGRRGPHCGLACRNGH